MNDPIAMSVRDASKMLGIGTTTLYGLLAKGKLRGFKVGRRRLIPTDSIRALIESA